MSSAPLLHFYVASSFRNVHGVRLLHAELERRGHAVFDWTRLAPPLDADMPVHERRAALDADPRGGIFEFCRNACVQSDLVIYYGPAGQDAACEVGLAWKAGTPVLGLRGPLEAPGTILGGCVSQWYDDIDDLLDAVDAYAEGRTGIDRLFEEIPGGAS